MKAKLFLMPIVILIVSVTILMESCQNSEGISETPSNTVTKVTKYNINKYSDTQSVLNMFEQYKGITRSMDINSKFDEYDFSSAYLSSIDGKDVNIFMIPSVSPVKDELLVGLTAGEGGNILYQLYFRKISDNEYTLYNESNEPIFSVFYDNVNQYVSVTNVYGNDTTMLPATRRAGWFSVACNVAVAAGCYGLGAIGAIPSGGASLGLAVCSLTISLALC